MTRHPRPRLRPDEVACLRYLSAYPDGAEPPRVSQLLLDSLVRRGLIEQCPLLAFPGLPRYERYRVTARGRRLLRQHIGQD
ncbi:MAG: hypothetical protein R3202_06355 [Candidatus Competibacterales bacterium]|nr:hypothetical protein [Candidatus Competibacterales bacterium]